MYPYKKHEMHRELLFTNMLMGMVVEMVMIVLVTEQKWHFKDRLGLPSVSNALTGRERG